MVEFNDNTQNRASNHNWGSKLDPDPGIFAPKGYYSDSPTLEQKLRSGNKAERLKSIEGNMEQSLKDYNPSQELRPNPKIKEQRI